MKRMLISCLTAIVALTAAADTLAVRNIFKEMPDSVLAYLSTNNRLDLIDFMDSNMKAEVTNSLGGKSQMTALTDDSISIRLNEACRVDIMLLNTTAEIDSCQKVIVLLRTFGTENVGLETGTPEFYSVSWKRLVCKPALAPADEKRLKALVKPSNILNKIAEKLNKQ